jgi:hypothetical protein
MLGSGRILLALVKTPPSSRGLGRSPFKAKTGVRISVGAQIKKLLIFQELFDLHCCIHGFSAEYLTTSPKATML